MKSRVKIAAIIAGLLLLLISIYKQFAFVRDLKEQHNAEKTELIYENKNLVQEISMSKSDFQKRESKSANIIDSLNKQLKNVKSVHIIKTETQYKWREKFVYLKGDTTYIETDCDFSFGSFGMQKDTGCISILAYTNNDIWPMFEFEVTNKNELYIIAERVRPYRAFWRLKWNRNKWAILTDVYSPCGEVNKNIKVEIK
jgi:hypothetical protein